jgi:exodeoxyribonuclease VII small subunit
MSAKKQTQTSFEESLQRLEEIVEKLDAGDVPLDEALKLYEEGMAVAKTCGERLSGIEVTLKRLGKEMEGHLKMFSTDEEE